MRTWGCVWFRWIWQWNVWGMNVVLWHIGNNEKWLRRKWWKSLISFKVIMSENYELLSNEFHKQKWLNSDWSNFDSKLIVLICSNFYTFFRKLYQIKPKLKILKCFHMEIFGGTTLAAAWASFARHHSFRSRPPKIRTCKKYLASTSQNPLATVASAAPF